MAYQSFMKCSLATVCMVGAGMVAAAEYGVTLDITEFPDEYAKLYDSAGVSLTSGTAMLGSFSGGISYDFSQGVWNTANWAEVKSNFVQGITPYKDSDGVISDAGFNIYGTMNNDSALADTPVYLMITEGDELGVFVVRSVEDDSILNWAAPSSSVWEDIYFQDKALAAEMKYTYYLDCILGSYDANEGAFALMMVPEPATASLSLLGLGALLLRRRRA